MEDLQARIVSRELPPQKPPEEARHHPRCPPSVRRAHDHHLEHGARPLHPREMGEGEAAPADSNPDQRRRPVQPDPLRVDHDVMSADARQGTVPERSGSGQQAGTT